LIDENENENSPNEIIVQSKLILGEKLKNPYSVENMQRALVSLNNTTKSNASLTPSHYYVRFLPDNYQQMEILNEDSLLILFEYPLDYEILQFGQYYHDPEIPDDKITWQYTVVEIDYTFPDVKYEILEDLYLPEEDERTIEIQSLKLTGNYHKSDFKSANARYYPSGYLKIEDDVNHSDLALINVKVKIRNWFTLDDPYTNSNGYFIATKSFGGDVDITVQFENLKCRIRSTLINISGTADIKLANEVTSLKMVICRDNRNTTSNPLPSGYSSFKDDKGWAWATTFNAIQEYWAYCYSNSVGRPPYEIRVWVNRNSDKEHSGACPLFHLGHAFYNLNMDNFWDFALNYLYIPLSNSLLQVYDTFLPDIIVSYGKDNTNSAYLSELVFHEFGHASHYVKVGNDFWNKLLNYEVTSYVNTIFTYKSVYGDGTGTNYNIAGLAESWAYHIGWSFLKLKYTTNPIMLSSAQENFYPYERGITNSYWDASWSGNKVAYFKGWIPAGIMYDLIDNSYEYIRGTYPDSYYDNASGYTNAKIFNALDDDVEGITAFRDNLLDENSNLDSDDVLDLFEAYYFD
jgi:hypothetical protein